MSNYIRDECKGKRQLSFLNVNLLLFNFFYDSTSGEIIY